MNFQLRIANYISRYGPSEKKLRSYLTKKEYRGDITILLKDLNYSESLLCDMWLRTFLIGSKGKREIELKLLKKEFPREMIQKKLEGLKGEIEDWSEHKSHIESQIQTLLSRRKSKQIISMTLAQKYPYFRDNIHELLEGNSDTDGLRKEIEKYKNKYNLSDRKEEQKFYNALLRKGFGYGEIKDMIRNWEN